jgi:hypothetical protein
MKRNIILAGILLLGMWSCRPGTKNGKAMVMGTDSTLQPENQQPASPLKMAMNMVGMNHVHIEYSAPGVRGGEIWGGLVPYDKIWVTGAHMATTIQFAGDLVIQGMKVPAGKYALFTIPGKDRWTVIINKTWDQHLTDKYDQKDDVLRFNISPTVQQELTEQLTFEVNSTGGRKGEIILKWEKLKLVIDVESME